MIDSNACTDNTSHTFYRIKARNELKRETKNIFVYVALFQEGDDGIFLKISDSNIFGNWNVSRLKRYARKGCVQLLKDIIKK